MLPLPPKPLYLKPSSKNLSGTFDLVFDSLRFFTKMWNFANWKLNLRSAYVNLSTPENETELEKQLPIQQPTFNIKPNKIIYTWIGHSTAVISVGNLFNFIIDPVFAERCSPVQFYGPKRFRRAACTIDQLPPIHAVFISHDHYDHLDSQALVELEKKWRPIFFAGLGSSSVLPKGASVVELDWTMERGLPINGHFTKVTFVPVCHWSQRGLNDFCERLWGGFVIQLPNRQIFYSGDTGYCEVFKEIGQKFKHFDLAILPIGAYEPREVLSPQHVNPAEAVRIHKEIGSSKSVGVHWGTFPLGYEHWHAARDELKKASQEGNLGPNEFVTLAHGGSLEIDI